MTEVPGDPAARPVRFGEGAFPPELDRVSWGAVFWAPLWALANGLWAWGVLLIAYHAASFVFFIYFNRSGFGQAALPGLVASVGSTILTWGLGAFLGVKGNRLAWLRAERLLAGDENPPAGRIPTTTSQFIAGQRIWVLSGVLLTAYSALNGFWSVSRTMPERVVPTVVALGVQFAILAGLYLWDRLHRGGSRVATLPE